MSLTRTDEVMALYALDMHLVFAGEMPEKYNRAAPEVSEAHHAAVEAARGVLIEHGYLPVKTGHGSRRLGTTAVETTGKRGSA